MIFTKQFFRFLFLVALIHFYSTSTASHLRGLEMSWECVGAGQDSGKFIFEIKMYRSCQGVGLGNSTQIYNPLYAVYGGASTISLAKLSGSLGQVDLSPICYDSSQQRKCNVTGENYGVYEQYIYRSAPVLIVGVPDRAGSEFWWSSAGGPSGLVNITTTARYYISATMYRYINPITGVADTLGTTGKASCYDSSPKYAENVPFLGFIGVMNYHSNQSSDKDGDQIVYGFDSVEYWPNSYYTYATGYSGQNPFPNITHNSSNIPLNLNSNTGNFTFKSFGLPGKYLIGHKTSSYRNGQLIADVFRTYIMLLDSVPQDPYNLKNKPPNISFKNSTDSVFRTSFADTFSVGQNILINVRAEDYDSLHSTALQSVSLRLIPQPYQLDPLNPNSCTLTNCAFLDTNNTAWKSPLFEDTSVVIGNLSWSLDCEHLGALNPASISGVYKTYHFSFLAKDNICPFPLSVIASLSITVKDTSESRNRIHQIEAQGDDNLISWPLYSFSKPFTFYKVYRTNSLSGTYSLLQTITSINDTSYLDTSALATQKPYFYKIETAASLSCNPNTNVVRSLHLATAYSGKNVALKWNDLTYFQTALNSGNYKIYSDTGLGWQLRATLAFGANTWTDSKVTCRNNIKYYIDAYDQTNGIRLISNIDSMFVSYFKQVNYSICPGDSIQLSGTWRFTADSYFDTVAAGISCDSVIERILSIDTTYQIPRSYEICDGDSLKITGVWRKQAGIYPQLLQSNKGCDSIINHELILKTVYQNIRDRSVCSGESIYDSVFASYFSNAGQYIKSFTSDLGCDSNYVLNITVKTVDVRLSILSKTIKAQQNGAVYQWIDCKTNLTIAGATGQSFTPTADGSYSVEITYDNCTDTSACVSITGVGIEDKDLFKSITVFPNPTKSKLFIQGGNTSIDFDEVVIYNIHGKLMSTEVVTTSDNLLTIDVANFSTGVYFLTLSKNGSLANFRFVKE